MRHWIITLIALTAAVVGFNTPVAAKATPQPTSTVLSHSKRYYSIHEDLLLAKYGIDQGFQTAFNRHLQIRVYDQTREPALNKAIQVAEKDWNSALGRKVFIVGSKRHHTLAVKMTTQSTTTESQQIAWWQPLSQTVLVGRQAYASEWQEIQQDMRLNALRSGESELVTDKVVGTARQVEYARILVHEFGHVLGLLHSTNPQDLMYARIGFADICQYQDVIQPAIWNSPLSQRDLRRGQLALKLVE